MPGPAVVTALRRARRGRVAVEVDGRPWRVVSGEAVLAAGLRPGLPLERPVLRLLRRELRRVDAMEAAARALEHRGLSRLRLDERLARAGVRAGERARALEALERAGAVDDLRLAESRAAALAERGWGDDAIAARLEQDGLGEEALRAALAALRPEAERAARAAARAADRRRAALRLARRGFSADAIESALGLLDADA